MKLFAVALTLLTTSSAFAADLRAKTLECSAVNASGYASLKLERENDVQIVINNLYTIQATITDIEKRVITLHQATPSREYRIEFDEALKEGKQEAKGILYGRFAPNYPLVATSYVSCKLDLVSK